MTIVDTYVPGGASLRSIVKGDRMISPTARGGPRWTKIKKSRPAALLQRSTGRTDTEEELAAKQILGTIFVDAIDQFLGLCVGRPLGLIGAMPIQGRTFAIRGYAQR
jgi:hypothetical protein